MNLFNRQSPEWYTQLEKCTAYKTQIIKLYDLLRGSGQLVVLLYSWTWHLDYTMRLGILYFLISISCTAAFSYVFEKVISTIFDIFYQRYLKDNERALNYRAYCRRNHLDENHQFIYKNSWLSDFTIDIESLESELSKRLFKTNRHGVEGVVRVVCWEASFNKNTKNAFTTQVVYFIAGQKGFRVIDYQPVNNDNN